MTTCAGRDRDGESCRANTFGQRRCYFHEKIADGLLSDYFTTHVAAEGKPKKNGQPRMVRVNRLEPLRSRAA